MIADEQTFAAPVQQSDNDSFEDGDRDDENHGLDKEPLGVASMASSIANLCNTIIGTGMLATPGTFRYTGILPAIFLICLCGFTSALGLIFLTLCADTLGGRRNSFFSVAMQTIPKGARLFDLAIAIKVSVEIYNRKTANMSKVFRSLGILPDHLWSVDASGSLVLRQGSEST